jgi:AraC-like DNA-binding protein
MVGINISTIRDSKFSIDFESNPMLTIFWNIGTPTEISIDSEKKTIQTNCILFFTEYYTSVESQNTSARIIQFDKDFLSPISTLNTIGDFLALFYGYHSVNQVPKITLNETETDMFNSIWNNMADEYANIKNPISEALLRNSLSRMLLLSQEIHMMTEFDLPIGFNELKTIREFQYLVNNNFMELTKVSDYAQIMKISAKKISEIFGCCYNKKASEIIAERRNLYAKRQLKFTDELIKNIAYDLNFSDSQAFSHFFKKQNGLTPEKYRMQHASTIYSNERI